MGWFTDYLEKLSLIDYANRQRHKMEHPEAYRIHKNDGTSVAKSHAQTIER